MKVVAGAGYGGYQAVPALDASWVVHWVRGPRTASLLGLRDRHDPPQPGDVADLTLLTPSLEVAATIVGGRVVHADQGLMAGSARMVVAP